jgi:hypothetical protein
MVWNKHAGINMLKVWNKHAQGLEVQCWDIEPQVLEPFVVTNLNLIHHETCKATVLEPEPVIR